MRKAGPRSKHQEANVKRATSQLRKRINSLTLGDGVLFPPFSQVTLEFLGEKVPCLVYLSSHEEGVLSDFCYWLTRCMKHYTDKHLNAHEGPALRYPTSTFLVSTQQVDDCHIVFTKLAREDLDGFIKYVLPNFEKTEQQLLAQKQQDRMVSEAQFHQYTLVHVGAPKNPTKVLCGTTQNDDGSYQFNKLPDEDLHTVAKQINAFCHGKGYNVRIGSLHVGGDNIIIPRKIFEGSILPSIRAYFDVAGKPLEKYYFTRVCNGSDTLYVCIPGLGQSFTAFSQKILRFRTRGEISDDNVFSRIKNGLCFLKIGSMDNDIMYCDNEVMKLLRNIFNFVEIVESGDSVDKARLSLDSVSGILPTPKDILRGFFSTKSLGSLEKVILLMAKDMKFRGVEGEFTRDTGDFRQRANQYSVVKEGYYERTNGFRNDFSNGGKALQDVAELLAEVCNEAGIYDAGVLAGMLACVRRATLECETGAILAVDRRVIRSMSYASGVTEDGTGKIILEMRLPKGPGSSAECIITKECALLKFDKSDLEAVRVIPDNDVSKYFNGKIPKGFLEKLKNCDNYTDFSIVEWRFLCDYFKKSKPELREKIKDWESSGETYDSHTLSILSELVKLRLALRVKRYHVSDEAEEEAVVAEDDESAAAQPGAAAMPGAYTGDFDDEEEAVAPPRRHLRSDAQPIKASAVDHLYEILPGEALMIVVVATIMRNSLVVANSTIEEIKADGQPGRVDNAGLGLYLFGGELGLTIKKGDMVAVFGGEVVYRDDLDEANKGMAAALSTSSLPTASKVIDGSGEGPDSIFVAQFANHQAGAGLRFESVFLGDGAGRALVAKEDIFIPPGQYLEVTFDYKNLSAHGISKQTMVPTKFLSEVEGIVGPHPPSLSQRDSSATAEMGETARTKRPGSPPPFPPAAKRVRTGGPALFTSGVRGGPDRTARAKRPPEGPPEGDPRGRPAKKPRPGT